MPLPFLLTTLANHPFVRYHNIAQSIAYEGRTTGSHVLNESETDSHLLCSGSNARLHRFFRKLQAGLPVSMGVVGGSVSAGHGLSHEGSEYPSFLIKPHRFRRLIVGCT